MASATAAVRLVSSVAQRTHSRWMSSRSRYESATTAISGQTIRRPAKRAATSAITSAATYGQGMAIQNRRAWARLTIGTSSASAPGRATITNGPSIVPATSA